MHNHSSEVDIKSFEKAATIAIEELKKIKKIPPSSYELNKNKKLLHYSKRKLKKIPLSSYKLEENEESSEYSKEIRITNVDTYKYNSPQKMRSFNSFLNWILLFLVLAGLGGIFYDYQNYLSIQVNKKPTKELNINSTIEVKKEDSFKNKISNNVIETKEKTYIKKKIDSNIIIIENNNVYYR